MKTRIVLLVLAILIAACQQIPREKTPLPDSLKATSAEATK